MKIILIKLFKLSLKIIYFFLKIFKTNNKKIVFMSRQSNEINLDFKMIKNELEQRDYNLKLVFLCKRLEKGMINSIKYYFTIIRQMYHLATSKICIIDSYCIPICVLNHKKELYILQIWHSIGKIKKSGYQTLDTPSGRNKAVAEIMCMHKNYDNIIAGGESFNRYYEESFNVKKDILLNYGLPRIDYILKNEKIIKQKILDKYQEFKNKKIIAYIPTFRNYEVNIDKLINSYDKKTCVLIVKPHPNQNITILDKDVYLCKEFSSIEILSVADYVITDYSSICLESAILNKKTLFYLYDYKKYISENGLNLDPKKIIPTCSFIDIEQIIKIINEDKYDNKAFQEFRKKYLPSDLGNSTKNIVNLICKHL